MNKKPKYLMIHCTATQEGKDYTPEQIMQWFKDRGWSHSGYRSTTHLDGKISVLQEYNHNDVIEPFEISNGAKGMNSFTIHLNYVGGVERGNINKPKDTRTFHQKRSLKAQVLGYVYLYPDIQVCGHYQFSRKACPSFDVVEWCRNEVCLDEKNIFELDMTPRNFRGAIDLDGDIFDFGPQKLRAL